MTPEADFLVALGSFIRTWLNRLNEMNGRAGWHGASWRHHPPRPSCWQGILDVHSCLDIVPWSLVYKALMGWAASSWGIFSVVTDLAMRNLCILLYGITRDWETWVVTNSFPDNLIHCSVPLHMCACVHTCACVSACSCIHLCILCTTIGQRLMLWGRAFWTVLQLPLESAPLYIPRFFVFTGNMDIYIYINIYQSHSFSNCTSVNTSNSCHLLQGRQYRGKEHFVHKRLFTNQLFICLVFC